MRRTVLVLVVLVATLVLASGVVLAVERSGGPGDDTLIGTNRGDILKGGRGDDEIRGLGDTGSQFDELHGGLGRDVIYGGPGDDEVDGGMGPDVLYGGAGPDSMFGVTGEDVLYGGDGNDYLDGRDESAKDTQRDELYCGTGRDTAIAGKLDFVSRSCEKKVAPPTKNPRVRVD